MPPRHANFQLDFRPDAFAEFDQLLQQLRDAIPEIETRAEILAALQLDGRDLNIDDLATEQQLTPDIVEVVRELAAFGDEGHWVHEFGSVHVAQISAGSDGGMCSVATYVMATRKGTQIQYWWRDENDGEGDLRILDQPATMAEVIALIDAVLLAQASYAVGRADWRDVYLCDESMVVGVTSDLYPELSAYYQASIAEWLAAHPQHE